MNLTTFENYMLLSVHPNSGKPMAGMFYHGLVGALLTDVHKAERLQIGNEFLVVNDTSSVDIPVVDFLLHKIGTFKEYKKISYWIPQLATNKVFKKLMIKKDIKYFIWFKSICIKNSNNRTYTYP